MQVKYTDVFTIDTGGITIRKQDETTGESAGGAIIPASVSVKWITLHPKQVVDGQFPDYDLCGLWDGSGWITIYGEIAVYNLGPMSDEHRHYAKVKAPSGTMDMFIQVKGV